MNRILYSMFYDMLEQEHIAYKIDLGLAVVCKKAPLWIWLRDGVNESDTRLFFNGFLERFGENLQGEGGGDTGLVGLVASKESALICADIYGGRYGLSYTTREMIGYYLPGKSTISLSVPIASGEIRLATPSDMPLVMEWIQRFYAETLEAPAPWSTGKKSLPVECSFLPNKKQPAHHSGVATKLYIWWDSTPVAMGTLSCTRASSRINLVYTPPELRGRGYAKVLTAALARQAQNNGSIPVLYTTSDNIAANKLYRGLGFLETGRLVEVRFK